MMTKTQHSKHTSPIKASKPQFTNTEIQSTQFIKKHRGQRANPAKTKKQKSELERGEKFLIFTMCDYDQAFEEEQQQTNSPDLI